MFLMRKCKFLSKPTKPLDLNEYLKNQYDRFIHDFVDNITYYQGMPIFVLQTDDKTDYGDLLNPYKGTCFTHIVSKSINQNSKRRDLDIERLQRCLWVKELIDFANNIQSACQNCQYYQSAVLIEHKNNHTYIFCKSVRYVVILMKITSSSQSYYIIKTAYYVDKEDKYRYLMKKLT